MSLYHQHILPPLLHWACGHPGFQELRQTWIPEARGSVLEIGVGSGRNLPFYNPEQVTDYMGIDPWLSSHQLESKECPFPCRYERSTAEEIPLPDSSIETVVCTFTLCSVHSPPRVAEEVFRVLQPGGKWILIEHGRAPDPGVQRWQNLLNPVWRPLAGNCHLNRALDEKVLPTERWAWEKQESYYIQGMAKVAGFVTAGILATRA